MSERIIITNEIGDRETDKVVKVLRAPRLYIPTQADYPEHDEWVGKTIARLEEGTTCAYLATVDGYPLAATVYRPDPDNPTIVDIRNISVNPIASGEGLGSFVVRRTELSAQADFSATTVRVDTKITNKEMLSFLEERGYTITDILELYEQGTGLDVILEKKLTPKQSQWGLAL